MCIQTCKLCYCNHRSPPKWSFCNKSIDTTIPSTSHQGPGVTKRPCEQAANQPTPTEICKGRFDFCCSPACCEYNTKAAESHYTHAADLLQRLRQQSALSDEASADQLTQAATQLEEQTKHHAVCASKRREYNKELMDQQPCLFEARTFAERSA